MNLRAAPSARTRFFVRLSSARIEVIVDTEKANLRMYTAAITGRASDEQDTAYVEIHRGLVTLRRIRLFIEQSIKGKWGEGSSLGLLQRHMLEKMLMVTLPMIYTGPVYTKYMHIIHKMHGIKVSATNELMAAWRRAGKTAAMCVLAAALLACCNKVDILVFSSNQRSTIKFKELVEDYLRAVPGTWESVIDQNQERLVLGDGTDGKRCILTALPGTPSAVHCFFGREDKVSS